MLQTFSGRRPLLRTVAIAGLTIACLQGTPAEAQKRDVSFRLDWIYQGPNAGFMVAKDKGFYDEAGLNVDMGPGKGSGSTAQLIASKTSQFGFADGFVVGAGVAKGMELAMVGAIYRRNPTAAIVLEESGIKTPKDLEGKSIGIAPGGTQFQQWPAFVKGCKLDEDKIKVINVDPAGTVPALVAGKVQAVASYAQGAVPGIEIRSKKKTTSFYYADCGVTAVSNGIIVHKDLLTGSRTDPHLRQGVAARVSLCPPASRRSDRHHQEVRARDRARDRQARARNVLPQLANSQHRGQADGMDVRQGLGCDGRDAQAIRRGDDAAEGIGPLHQRVRSGRQ